jgi:hypothetical protein
MSLNSSFCTTHQSSVSTGFTEQIMPILETRKWSWNEQKYGRGFRLAPVNDCAGKGQQQITTAFLCTEQSGAEP